MNFSIKFPILIVLVIIVIVLAIFKATQPNAFDQTSLEEYAHKLETFWNNGTLGCKNTLANCKIGVLDAETVKQRLQHDRLKKQFEMLIESKSHHVRLNNTRLHELIAELEEFIRYHETTEVDICDDNVKCQKCLENNVDCWYTLYTSATRAGNDSGLHCTKPSHWHVVNYQPKKIALNCTIMDNL